MLLGHVLIYLSNFSKKVITKPNTLRHAPLYILFWVLIQVNLDFKVSSRLWILSDQWWAAILWWVRQEQ